MRDLLTLTLMAGPPAWAVIAYALWVSVRARLALTMAAE